jgi:hypothetical protein
LSTIAVLNLGFQLNKDSNMPKKWTLLFGAETWAPTARLIALLGFRLAELMRDIGIDPRGAFLSEIVGLGQSLSRPIDLEICDQMRDCE